ncbi:GPP34 family phosphoprotein [Bacillus sp. HMF5848]|uniref:GOLPH3/VPS74 family protein n=1 Tax=Bacillus sp. HMF5848 TaxID=2495421 RepID=UPI000F7A4895|nr:GPP34 family phosphoprotein [Bacillus sp. HMF5848]RSK26695.1 GPP34 family phosphoprotein [Bacillus sp. HMF5848]
MLTLPERFLLFSLDDDSGKFVSQSSLSLPYGLAGAILLELQQSGHIALEENTLYITNCNKAIDDSILQDALTFMSEKNKLKNIRYWVQTVGHFVRKHKLKDQYVNRLIDKGILVQEDATFLMLFKKDVFPAIDSTQEDDDKQRIRLYLIENQPPGNEQIVLLIALLRAAQMDKLLFKKAEYKIVKKKATAIMKDNPYSKAVADTVQAVQAAVVSATT